MNKKFLLELQRAKRSRLEALETEVRAEGLSADDAKKIKDEVDAINKDLQDIADQLAAATDDGNKEGDNTEDDNKDDNSGSSDDSGSDDSSSSDDGGSDDDGDKKDTGKRSAEMNKGALGPIATNILKSINRGQNLTGNSAKKLEERQREAFFGYVAGKTSSEEARSLGIISGNGGVTVPKTIASDVISYAQEENVLRRFGTIHKTTSTEGYPVLVKAPTANGHKKERDADSIPDSDVEFDEIVMDPAEFDALATVTKKLLKRTDVPLEKIILDELTKSYTAKEIDYMFNGTETGNENPGSLSKKAVEFKPAAAIDMTKGPEVYKGLVAFKHAVKASVRKNSIFIMNDAAEALVESMLDDNGRPLYRDDIQVAEGINGRLVGANTVVTEGANVPDNPEMPVFYYGDMRSFHIQDVNGSLEVQKLDQLFALTNKMGYKIYNILDAQLIYSPLEPTVYKWIADGEAKKA
ncbi:phage major capsid protein [Loigolactobacillus bifermentans]|uniref:Major capsid protein n=1 Tax=Loigolactobacillus bifermentans DSM 20003 TaxID=1423726 RepID=A0A0R1GXB1_9LACO|nr:phage major capsid protein [Loigolactobacillus bifermentans]KRK38987.1 major capsid protein [Loigolactobacillus bifermentans DSM 20003]QGG59128.1 phage major capsid protein [Loigolactobacillus bifermentans]